MFQAGAILRTQFRKTFIVDLISFVKIIYVDVVVIFNISFEHILSIQVRTLLIDIREFFAIYQCANLQILSHK